MTIIKGHITSDFFDCDIEISGDTVVQDIKCADRVAKHIVTEQIRQGEGYLANDYHPEPDTMLQAYALLTQYSNNITVDGELEVIPYEEDQEGVVY